MKNQISLLLVVIFFSGCQVIQRRQGPTPQPLPGVQAPGTTLEVPQLSALPEEQTATQSIPVSGSRPRLALILGPGGLRSYAHAGLLQEIAKAKIPVYWVGGLETGALPAALFSLKGQPFEAEWQMMKMKEDDWVRKGLLSGASAQKVDTLTEPLKLMFGSARVEDAKLPYMCTSYSLSKKQTFLMYRGAFAQMLAYCLPSPPLFETFQGNGANPVALSQIAHAARQKGAQLLVYVDVMGLNTVSESENGFMWGLYQQAIEFQLSSVTEVIRIPGLPGIRDFGRRREMLQKGQEAGRRLVQTLQTKYGY